MAGDIRVRDNRNVQRRSAECVAAMLVTGLWATSANAAVIAQYTFDAGSTTAPVVNVSTASAISTTTAAGVTAGSLSGSSAWLGTDPVANQPATGISSAVTGGNPLPGIFARSGTVIGTGFTPGTEDAAVSGGHYFTFTVTPDGGQKLNLTTLSFDTALGSGSAVSLTVGYAVRSNVDGFGSRIGSATSVTMTSATSTPWTTTTLDLSGANYQNRTDPIEFRVYIYDNASNAGVARLDNVTLSGSVVPVPEPLLLPVVGLGALTLRRRRQK